MVEAACAAWEAADGVGRARGVQVASLDEEAGKQVTRHAHFDLSGRLKFTVRRQKVNKYFLLFDRGGALSSLARFERLHDFELGFASTTQRATTGGNAYSRSMGYLLDGCSKKNNPLRGCMRGLTLQCA